MRKTNKIARYVKVTPSLERKEAKTKPSGLYLVELRSRLAETQAALPKRKLVVKIEAKNIPLPVKGARP
jgi:hypothetical protein